MNNKQLDIDECVEKYFKNLKQFKPLKKEEERKLIEAYKLRNDISARNKLIEHNLRYACQLANGYRNKGLSFSDLISEANNGLIDAIEKYDVNQDVKLISYSKWWIIQRMQAALERENKIPKESLDIEEDEESLVNSFYGEYEDIDNAKLSFEEDDFDYNEILNNKYLIEQITSKISPRERDIIYRYYGVNQDEKYTLEDVGKIYGLTRERVRQIIDKSMTKMRSEALLIDSSYL